MSAPHIGHPPTSNRHGAEERPSTPRGHRPLEKIVFISACEQSADEHAAALIRETLNADPDIVFVGIAGPKMVAAGCESLFDMTQHSAMLLGAVGAIGKGVRMLSIASEFLRMNPVAAAVVVDSPTLHLPLAARAKAAGVPVLYYIAPQLWAWGAYRIYKLRHNVERLACILPFEEEYFRNQGVNATYVGHPLAEKLAKHAPDQQLVGRLRALGQPLIALLPGSRKHVVEEVLPGQLQIAAAIRDQLPSASFVVSIANATTKPIINRLVAGSPVPILAVENLTDLVRASDLALAASGTTTLEAAMLGCPMIVMYNASRIFYHLAGRWMIRTKFLSLPNILAGREVVPEFMPYYTSTTPIAHQALQLLNNPQRRAQMSEDLRTLTAPFLRTQASKRTSTILGEMLALKPH